MTTALARRQPVTPDIWTMVQQIAPVIHASHIYKNINSPDQAMAVMIAGYELGFGLSASFKYLPLIQGEPALSPQGGLALIHQSGELDNLVIKDDPGKCTVTMRRKSGMEYTAVFTIEDAKKAGLVKPDSNYQRWEANMLRWRAVGFCEDVVFPDIIAGFKRADELGAAIDESGTVIEAEFVENETL